MRVCRLCAGPMPEIVRDDALYCSTSCKLKAQRKRKKERSQKESEDSPRAVESVTPFGVVEQLSFSFINGVAASLAPTEATPNLLDTTITPKPPLNPEKPKAQSWLGRLAGRIKKEVIDPKPIQRSKGGRFDLI